MLLRFSLFPLKFLVFLLLLLESFHFSGKKVKKYNSYFCLFKLNFEVLGLTIWLDL